MRPGSVVGLLHLVAIAAAGCSLQAPVENEASSAGAIVNGHPATSAEGLARITFAGQPWCGGALIAPNWVLTAAHCVEDTSPSQLAVRIGVLDLRTSGAARTVTATHVHDEYDPGSFLNDVALLELAPSSDPETTVTLAGCADAATPAVGASVDLFGWGATAPSDERSQSSILQTATSQVVDCKRFDHTGLDGDALYRDLDPANAFCVGDAAGVANACGGDSGGPLLTKAKNGALVVAGVDSRGLRKCGDENRPTVFVRVGPYLPWIHATTNGAAGVPSCTK